MLQTSHRQHAAAQPDMHFSEFVALMAMMMAMVALSLDIMLPALGVMGQDLGLAANNDRQLIITFYLMGFAVGQIFWGPLSDRFGRKMPLYAGMAVFIVGSILAAATETANAMLAARVFQGLGTGAPRIIGTAIIRDRFAGRGMARVMSFIMMVFLITPILAPSLGQLLLEFGSWRMLFMVLLVAGAINAIWLWLRLPETLSVDKRLPLSRKRIITSIGISLTTRQTVGYMIGFGFMFGVLMSYIGSAEQLFVDVYRTGENFPLYFAAIASSTIVAAILNAKLVGRLGMRRISHIALLVIILLSAIMALSGFPKELPLWLFCIYMSSVFFCFGLIAPNFNALAMEYVGNIAGTASSLIGFYATGVGALFGFLVGQSFDGSIRPLMIGIAALSALTLVTVLITERGKLAQPHHDQDA